MRGKKKHISDKEDNTQWVNTDKIEKQTSKVLILHAFFKHSDENSFTPLQLMMLPPAL